MPDRQAIGNTDNIRKREESKQSSSLGCVCNFKIGPGQQLYKLFFPLQCHCHRLGATYEVTPFPPAAEMDSIPLAGTQF